jgi:hypothetical protein
VQVVGELQDLEPLGDAPLGHADPFGDALAGQSLFVHQPPVRLGLLDHVELDALDVLDDRELQAGRALVRLAHDDRHLTHAGELGGTVAPLAGDQPVAIAVLGHHEPLQHAVDGDRSGELVELLPLEAVARVEAPLYLDVCQRHGALLCLRDGLGGHASTSLDLGGPARCGPDSPGHRTRRVRSRPGGRPRRAETQPPAERCARPAERLRRALRAASNGPRDLRCGPPGLGPN